MVEIWLPVVGFEELYEVSSLGAVRSFPRQGTQGLTLSQFRSEWGYMMVHLCRDGKLRTRAAHKYVAEAFHGPCPEGQETRHLDGDPANNRADNLRYGTKSENAQDRIRHGHHGNLLKTHCPQGHPYDEVNTRRTPDGRHRYCLTCKREKNRAFRARKRAREQAELGR